MSRALLFARILTRLQWIIIDSRVYDVTRFRKLHPGGMSVFIDEGIRECSAPPVTTPLSPARHYIV